MFYILDGSKEENNVQLNGEEEEDVTSVEERVGKFSWEAAIIGVLKAASDQEISVKKLKKKVQYDNCACNLM